MNLAVIAKQSQHTEFHFIFYTIQKKELENVSLIFYFCVNFSKMTLIRTKIIKYLEINTTKDVQVL